VRTTTLKRIVLQDDGSVKYPEEEFLKEGWARLDGVFEINQVIFHQRGMGFCVLVDSENLEKLRPLVGRDLFLQVREVPILERSVDSILPSALLVSMQYEWRIEAPPDGKHVATAWGFGKRCG
jgi:hypothetical protein